MSAHLQRSQHEVILSACTNNVNMMHISKLQHFHSQTHRDNQPRTNASLQTSLFHKFYLSSLEFKRLQSFKRRVKHEDRQKSFKALFFQTFDLKIGFLDNFLLCLNPLVVIWIIFRPIGIWNNKVNLGYCQCQQYNAAAVARVIQKKNRSPRSSIAKVCFR